MIGAWYGVCGMVHGIECLKGVVLSVLCMVHGILCIVVCGMW